MSDFTNITPKENPVSTDKFMGFDASNNPIVVELDKLGGNSSVSKVSLPVKTGETVENGKAVIYSSNGLEHFKNSSEIIDQIQVNSAVATVDYVSNATIDSERVVTCFYQEGKARLRVQKWSGGVLSQGAIIELSTSGATKFHQVAVSQNGKVLVTWYNPTQRRIFVNRLSVSDVDLTDELLYQIATEFDLDNNVVSLDALAVNVECKSGDMMAIVATVEDNDTQKGCWMMIAGWETGTSTFFTTDKFSVVASKDVVNTCVAYEGTSYFYVVSEVKNESDYDTTVNAVYYNYSEAIPDDRLEISNPIVVRNNKSISRDHEAKYSDGVVCLNYEADYKYSAVAINVNELAISAGATTEIIDYGRYFTTAILEGGDFGIVYRDYDSDLETGAGRAITLKAIVENGVTTLIKTFDSGRLEVDAFGGEMTPLGGGIFGVSIDVGYFCYFLVTAKYSSYWTEIVGVASETKTDGEDCLVVVNGLGESLNNLPAIGAGYISDDGSIVAEATEIFAGNVTDTDKMIVRIDGSRSNDSATSLARHAELPDTDTSGHPASIIDVDNSGFTGNLSDMATDDVQEALRLVDNLDISSAAGRSTFVDVYNNTGGLLQKGKIVYPTGSFGEYPTVDYADNRYYDKSRFVGMIREDIPDGSAGIAVVFGIVTGFDTSSLIEGKPAYLGFDGDLTTTRPTGESFTVTAGFVSSSDAVDGIVVMDRSISDTTEEVTDTNGFPPDQRDNTTFAFVNGTRTFTIAPVGDTFYFYEQGHKICCNTSKDLVISDVQGLHAIYFEDGELAEEVNPIPSAISNIIRNKCLVSYVYWNVTDQEMVFMLDERHGISMSPQTHAYLHFTRGAQFLNGLSLGGFVIDNGNDDEDAQFSVESGLITDEDNISFSNAIASTVGIPVFYLDGSANLLKEVKAGFSVLTDVDTGVGATGRLVYNRNTGGVWDTVAIANNDFVLYHVFAVNSYSMGEKIISIMGQNDYTTEALALEGASSEIKSILSVFPFEEIVPLGTIVFQTSTSYANAVKARVIEIDTGIYYQDWRTTELAQGANPTSHANLTELSSSGHPALVITTDTTNFDGVLSGADTDVQKALETIDALVIPEQVTLSRRQCVVTGSIDRNTANIDHIDPSNHTFGNPNFLADNGTNSVKLQSSIANPFVVSIADGNKDYNIFVATDQTPAAWDNMAANSKFYLYMDYNPTTQVVTYGKTTTKPIYTQNREDLVLTDTAKCTQRSSVPAMFSDVQDGIILSASAGDAYDVFDMSITSFWNGSTNSGTIEVDFQRPIVIDRYSLRAAANWFRLPNDWTFEGYNGTTWDVLHTVTNETSYAAREKRIYDSDNTTAYEKYRLNITDTDQGGQIELAGFDLLERIGDVFDTSLMQMFTYDHVLDEWNNVERIYIGEVVTGATEISSIKSYSFNGTQIIDWFQATAEDYIVLDNLLGMPPANFELFYALDLQSGEIRKVSMISDTYSTNYIGHGAMVGADQDTLKVYVGDTSPYSTMNLIALGYDFQAGATVDDINMYKLRIDRGW